MLNDFSEVMNDRSIDQNIDDRRVNYPETDII